MSEWVCVQEIMSSCKNPYVCKKSCPVVSMGIKDQPMSVLPADPMADVFFGTSADVRSDVFSRHKQCPQKRKLVLTYH